MRRYIHRVLAILICATLVCAPVYTWALQFNYLGQEHTITDIGNIATNVQYNSLNQGTGQLTNATLSNAAQTKSFYTPITLTVSGQPLSDNGCRLGKICAKTLGNGNVLIYQYTYNTKINSHQNLSNISVYQPTDASHTNYTLIYQIAYHYNLAGELTQKTQSIPGHPNQNIGHTYDTLGRLVSSEVDNQSIHYRYDANSNKLQTSGTKASSGEVNGLDQLISHNKLTLAYTANGNMASNGSSVQYHFNARNQLVSLHNTSETYQYDYTANGLRWQKSLANNASVLQYYYDKEQLLNTLQIKSTATAGLSHYLLADSRIARLLTTSTDHKLSDPSNITYYLLDQKQTVTGHLNSTGQLTSTQQYNDYGTPTTKSSAQLTDLSLQTDPFGYDGEQYDPESGLSYLRARYYDPTLGRFIAQDSYGLMNRYTFANGDPINRIDPNGHMSFWKTLNLVMAIGSVAILFGGAGAVLTGYALGLFETDELAVLTGETVENTTEDTASVATKTAENFTETSEISTPKSSGDLSSNSEYSPNVSTSSVPNNENTQLVLEQTESADLTDIDENESLPPKYTEHSRDTTFLRSFSHDDADPETTIGIYRRQQSVDYTMAKNYVHGVKKGLAI